MATIYNNNQFIINVRNFRQIISIAGINLYLHGENVVWHVEAILLLLPFFTNQSANKI